MIPALEIRIIVYALMALGVMTGTAYATHRLDDARYSELQAQFSDYKARAQSDATAAQKAYVIALQAQIARHNMQEAANAQTIATLTSQAAAARESADFANRLLARAAQVGSSAPGAAMPSSAGQSRIAGASGRLGDQPTSDFARDVAGAAAECKAAIEHLDRLQIELTPQLRMPAS